MTTIRDELAGFTPFADKLRALGIDPDLPAEWATVDRCLTWLDHRGFRWPRVIDEDPVDGDTDLRYTVGVYSVDADGISASGPTLHAALIAACQAVEEAS